MRQGWLSAVLLASLAACHCETRDTQPFPDGSPRAPLTTELQAGGARPVAPDPRAAYYETSAWHQGEGQRLYEQFNCDGCHGGGGGGDIGPPLIDNEWIYGGSSEQIVATLMQGRPNGMPSFRNKLTEQQMWELAAYVRAMAGLVRKDVPSSRSDTMANTPSLSITPSEPQYQASETGGGH